MAATDMKLAGLEPGARFTVPEVHEGAWPLPGNVSGKHGAVVERPAPGPTGERWDDQVLVTIDGERGHLLRQYVVRDYAEAQEARQRRAQRLADHFPGKYDLAPSDTLERFCGVQENEDDRGIYWLHFADTFEEVAELLGGEVFEGWSPVQVYDLDTGEAIELHVASPVVTRSEDQGVMVNALDVGGVQHERH